MIVCATMMITNRGERNFQPLIQRGRDSMEHGEGVALIVGVFESSYIGLFGADELRELLLCQPSFGSSLVNEPVVTNGVTTTKGTVKLRAPRPI